MLKKISVLVLIVFCLMLQGCSKCIKEEYIQDTVTIVDISYHGAWIQQIPAGKTMAVIFHPAEYITVVDYKRMEHSIYDKDTYNFYKNKNNEQVQANILVKTYDNGKVKYNIENLIK